MKPATCSKLARDQRGDAILEALIGIFLLAIIGLGLGFASARATVSQRYLNTQNIVASDMREQLMNANAIAAMCDNQTQSAINVSDSSIALGLSCNKGQVTVLLGNSNAGNNNSISAVVPAGSMVTSLILSTPANDNSKALLGGDGKVEIGMH